MVALARALATWCVVPALALAFAAPAAPLAAQQETLTPAACAVEPRTSDEIAALGAVPQPAPAHASPTASELSGGSPEPPEGEPADPETAAQVADALAQVAGCLNANDRPRLLALLTDRFAAEVAMAWEEVGAPAAATPVADSDASALAITSFRVRSVGLLPGERAFANVGWRFGNPDDGGSVRMSEILVFGRTGGRWLVEDASGTWLFDGEIGGRRVDEATAVATYPEDGAAASLTDDEILRRAPSGFGEVDSAVYAEPTLMGAQFSVEALLMVGFANNDDPEAVGCEFFVIERGAHSATASAACRADEALVGRAAYLRVSARGPNRGSGTPATYCEDVALLESSMIFTCTVELSEPVP